MSQVLLQKPPSTVPGSGDSERVENERFPRTIDLEGGREVRVLGRQWLLFDEAGAPRKYTWEKLQELRKVRPMEIVFQGVTMPVDGLLLIAQMTLGTMFLPFLFNVPYFIIASEPSILAIDARLAEVVHGAAH